MNETIRRMMNHRSIRKYTDQPISDELLRTIIGAAQMAATSSNVQAYSVIHVKDQTLKDQLAEYSGNKHVAECAAFLVWCADLYRLREVYAMRYSDREPTNLHTTENMVVAITDVALAAQNAAVAAESAGLGITYIGGIRNRIADVAELLGIPELVIPVYGMCLGYPDQTPILRPRLPQKAVLHENRYDDSSYREAIAEYDQAIEAYMRERSGGKQITTWSQNMTNNLDAKARLHMKEFLERQGFGLK